MTVADVAFGSAWPAARPPLWMVALFAIAMCACGLVALAVRFSDAGTYAVIARDAGFAGTRFLLPANDPRATLQPIDLETQVGMHERWVAYVLGRSDLPPGPAAFTIDETRHMADVRRVFVAAQAVMYAALGGAIVLFGFALRRGARLALLVLRDGALWAGAAVLVLGLVAAIAFEPAFLVFHYLFFPQGNFLFDPATSNLLRLYPEPYWYGVTIRIGAAFVGTAAFVTLAATAALRTRWPR